MCTLSLTSLATADWLVLAAYFGALIGLGVWTSLRKVRTTDDYFLAARSMPVWAVAFSILSTAQSAATYVGVPQQGYEGNLTYLSSNIGGVLAAIILAAVVIPIYYRRRLTTPYQLLEDRLGPTGRIAASWAYLVGRVFASGARVFMAAIPTAIVVFGQTAHDGHLAIVIVSFSVLGVMISLFGGVRSVIWIDVMQVAVYLGAAVATIVVLLRVIPADVPTIVQALAHPPPDAAGQGTPSKLTVLSFSTDPGASFTLWTALTGFVLLTLASHGMDQDLVQRMLTCKSASRGSWSVISGVLIGIPAVLVFLLIGLLLYVFYQRPDIMQGAAGTVSPPARSDKVFQVFALDHMTGGLAGLVIAGLFACGPASINSGLSAMSSTFVNDLYRPWRPGRCERHYVRIGRLGVAGAGAALGGLALLCIAWYDPRDQTVIDFVLSIMNFAYAGLIAVFFTALFTRRGNARSAIAALFTGFIVVLFFQTSAWTWLARAVPSLVGAPAGADVTTDLVKRAWPWLTLAFPWQLCAASGIAAAVCCLGAPATVRGVREAAVHSSPS